MSFPYRSNASHITRGWHGNTAPTKLKRRSFPVGCSTLDGVEAGTVGQEQERGGDFLRRHALADHTLEMVAMF